ncbi:MAG: hypothetical protein AAGA85_06975 [Bacteroidota bacterium]
MKATKSVLVMSTDEKISKLLMRLIGEMDQFEGLLCPSIDELPTLLAAHDFDILLQGAGFSEAEEQRISALVRSRDPKTAIVSHYGGGSGLLYAELAGALNALGGKNGI